LNAQAALLAVDVQRKGQSPASESTVPGSPGAHPVEGLAMSVSSDVSHELERTATSAGEVTGGTWSWQAFGAAARTLITTDQVSELLPSVVDSVRRATSARSVAFGTMGTDGRLVRFDSADAVDAVTGRADAAGVPLEDRDPAEAALASIAAFDRGEQDPAAPAAVRSTDPAMMVVPVPVDGRAFGVLVLSGGPDDGFSDEEEELVVALAAVAGAAIRKAQLTTAARRRDECSATSLNVVSAALDRPTQALTLVARSARRYTHAAIAAVEVPIGDNAVMLEACDGVDRDVAGRVFPLDEAPLYAAVMQKQRPIVIADAAADELMRNSSVLAGRLVGPVLAVPLIAARRCVGMLTLANPPGVEPFTALDVEMATTFAAHAALAVQTASTTQRERRLARLEDREQLAREVNDGAIQLLFSCGLRLESMLPSMDDAAAVKLASILEDMDQTIDAIRAAILSYRESDPDEAPLRVRLAEVVADARRMLGFTPALRADALLDDLVPRHVHSHVLAVVQEAILSSARSAGATHAELAVTARADGLTIEMSDDGRGLSRRRQDHGLGIMRSLAAQLGGHMYTGPGIGGAGIKVTWSMPLRQG
jgi:GAF domain-containing protein